MSVIATTVADVGLAKRRSSVSLVCGIKSIKSIVPGEHSTELNRLLTGGNSTEQTSFNTAKPSQDPNLN